MGLPSLRCPAPWRCSRAGRSPGLPTDRFLFEGFLPPKSEARRARLNALAAHPRDAGVLRGAAAASREPRRSRRGTGRPAGHRRARTHQTSRGNAPRRLADARRRITPEAKRARARSSSSSGRRREQPATMCSTSTARSRRRCNSHTTKDAAAAVAARHRPAAPRHLRPRAEPRAATARDGASRRGAERSARLRLRARGGMVARPWLGRKGYRILAARIHHQRRRDRSHRSARRDHRLCRGEGARQDRARRDRDRQRKIGRVARAARRLGVAQPLGGGLPLCAATRFLSRPRRLPRHIEEAYSLCDSKDTSEPGMALKVAVQMDPIERIKSPAIPRSPCCWRRKRADMTLLYYTPDRLSLIGGDIFARVQPLRVKDEQGDHAALGEAGAHGTLRESDVVLLRQDPPFDLAYVTSTHLLERLQPKTLVVNDPRSVRNAPEKMLVMDFPELMPPTLISRDRDEIQAFRERHRRRRDEAALRARRRGGVQDRRQATPISARCSICSRRRFASPG